MNKFTNNHPTFFAASELLANGKLFALQTAALMLLKVLVLIVVVFMIFACGGGSKPANTLDLGAATNQPGAGDGTDSSNNGNTTQELPLSDTVACDAPSASVQQSLLNAINLARASARQCGADHYNATHPLVLNAKLSQAANAHSTDMASANFFSHIGSDGLQVWDRATALGYVYQRIAENIAAGQTTTTEVHESWLNSTSHCINIMDPDVTELGAACIANPNSDNKTYWTTVFGRPLP